MKEKKVLLVICDDVNERTLREFLRIGGYKFSDAYIRLEEEPPKVEAPVEGGGA